MEGNMKRLFVLGLLLFLLVACGPSDAVVNEAVEGTISAYTPIPTYTLLPTYTPVNTYTPYPTYTSIPTDTPLPLPSATSTPETVSGIFAKNYVASQESGGVTIEIARFLYGDKAAIEEATGNDFSQVDEMQNTPVVVEIVFKITNNNTEMVKIYPDQGTVVINNEQVELTDWLFAGTSIGDDLGGDLYPGVILVGGLWFGVQRTSIEDLSHVIVAINAPTNSDYDHLGEDFYIEFDTLNWTFEPLPSDW
jgi:hypothetical protein